MPDAIARKGGGAAQKATAKTTTPKATMAKADPQENSAASASAGAEAPSPFVIDELAMALSSDIMLPMIEVPIPAGPGSSDPFGIMPPMLFVGYDHPLTVLDQFFGGGQSGGRTTFMDAYEGGFFRDLSIATSSDLKFVTLRPTMSAYAPPSPQEQAISRMFTKGIMAIGALLTPGPQDDIALETGAAGANLTKGAGAEVRLVSPRMLRLTENLSSPSQAAKMSKLMGGERGFGPFNPIDVVESDGILYIADGHHRAVAAAKAGLREVPVRVRSAASVEEGQDLFRSWAATLKDRGF